jgi:hypothetical protein
VLDIHEEPAGFFPDYKKWGRRFAQEVTAARFKSFLQAHIRVRSFVNSDRREHLKELGNDLPSVTFRPGAEKLANQKAGVSIDDHSGKPVRFGVHEPASAVAEFQERGAESNGLLQPGAKEFRSHLFAGIKGPGSQGNLGRGGISGPAEKFALMGEDLDGLAGSRIAFHLFNGP